MPASRICNRPSLSCGIDRSYSPWHAIDAVSPTLIAIEDGNHAELGANGNFCAPALIDKIRLKGVSGAAKRVHPLNGTIDSNSSS